MKRLDEMERRVLSICWLDEHEMRELRVKDLIWKEGWLYAVHRWRDYDLFLDSPGKESSRGYTKYIWMVGELWIPVIVGQEHILLQLVEGRGPDDHVFSEVHMPSRRVLERLKRQYASRLYTMFSGRTPPIDNRRFDCAFSPDVNSRYDFEAVYDVAHVLREDLRLADYLAHRYIGRRSPRRRKGEDKPILEGMFGKEDAEGNVAPYGAVSLPSLRLIENDS